MPATAEALARVAFIAVRRQDGKTDGPLEAVVIGTNDKAGTDWRYVCYPIDRLKQLLSEGRNPFEDQDYLPYARYHDGRREGDERSDIVRCHDDFNPPADGLLELRNIVVCSLYRAPTPATAQASAWDVFNEGPLARFDTIGFAVQGDTDTIAPDWMVSRLVLKPLSGRSGLIESFTFDLQIRIALNGHDTNSFPHSKDRYDPRILASFSATRGSNPRSLWKAGNRAAVCDSIQLRLTIRPWDSGGPSIGSSHPNGDLIDFVENGQQNPHGTSDPIDALPWFAEQGIIQPSGKPVFRSFGLRAVGRDKDQTTRIALRFELRIESFFDKVKDIFGLVAPNDALTDLPTNGYVNLAQEQRLGDIADFAPRSPQWLATVRIDPKPNTDSITAAIAASYSQNLPPIAKSLRTVRDGGPLSALPKLSPAGLKDVPWHAVGLIEEGRAWRRIIVSPTLPIGDAKDKRRRTSFISFEPRLITDMWDGVAPTEVAPSQYHAIFNRLVGTRRETPRYKSLISAPLAVAVTTVKVPNCISAPAFQPGVSEHDIDDHGTTDLMPCSRFGLTLQQLEGADNVSVALGALGFVLQKQPDLTLSTKTELTGLVALHEYGDKDADLLPMAIDALIKLPIERVMPIGQDDLPPAIREQMLGRVPANGRDPYEPLLFDLLPAAQSNPKMVQSLAVMERLARGEDQNVTIALRAVVYDKPELQRRLVLVIDSAPFRAAAVEYIEPAFAGGLTSQEVGVWNAGGENGLSWRIRDESQTVRIVLPPQVIGEAMEKNATTLPDAPKDIEVDHPAAARFGSPARLDVDPTFFDTDYREPGWNLRRNLGYPNQRFPGSRLKELRLELIYGMTTRVRPGDSGIDAWITEMSGTIGAPVPALTDAAGFDKPYLKRHLKLARKILEAQRLRLAVDKLWSGKPDTELRFDDGLAFRLRTRPGAKDIAAGRANQGPQTKLRWPVPGDVPTDTGGLIDPIALADTFSTIQDDRESFPGGVAWAFESANILMSVFDRPDSTSGRLQGAYLSAHGGYGGQRALFDDKKTVIESETAQGRVHRYKLERIGRIGGLWNRAKHVIIYERTVVPPAQFYNLDPIGLRQDEHVGRPILRKVEEYVEILQPERRYPEDGTSVSAAGFLVGSDFKSRKIRVDSAWGGDVRREGWQVPLWNKVFDVPVEPPNNPDAPALIYPKPQIRFLLAGEGSGEVSAEVAEPEKLVFYTSVVRGESGDNTDLWRPVRDIDFIDLPPPSAGRIAPRSEYLTDATLPPEPAHAAGYERLTIGLVRANEAAALAHGRTATGPATILKNVTLARAAVLPGGATASQASNLGQSLAQGGADLRALVDAKIGQALGALEKVDSRLSPADAKTAAWTELKKALDQPNFTADVKAATDKLGKDVQSIGKGVNIGKPCDALAARLEEVVQGQTKRLRLVAEQAIVDAKAQVLAPVDAIRGIAGDVLVWLQDGQSLSEDERLALLDRLGELEERLLDIIEQARDDIERLDKRVTADLDALKGIAGGSLGSAQQMVLDNINAANKAISDLVTLIGNAPQVTDPIKQAIDGTYDELVEIRDAINAISDDVGSGERRILIVINAGLAPLFIATRELAALDINAPLDVSKLKAAGQTFDDLATKLLARLSATGSAAIDAAYDALNDYVANGKTFALGLVDKAVAALYAKYDDDMKPADDGVTIFERIDDVIRALASPGDWGEDDDSLQTLIAVLKTMARGAITVANSVTSAVDDLTKGLDAEADKVKTKVDVAAAALIHELQDACKIFEGYLETLLQQAGLLTDWINNALDLDGYKKRLNDELESIVKDASVTYEEMKRRVSEKAAEITRLAENRARQLAGSMQETLRDALGTDPADLADQAARIYQQGSDTLRVLRAVGDPPKTDRLGFNRPEVAFVLAETNKIVDMTPAIALVNRVSDTIAAAEQAGKAVGDLLQSFGVRLPSSGIGEQVLSDKLKGLSVSDLLPNMGGIDFRGLLQNFGFPDLDDSKAIKVRHGFDQAHLTAWLESEVDVPFAEPAPILSFGPVQIMVDDARFNALARMSASPGGTQKSMNGRIFGDWRVVCSGQDILTFRQTGLFFDNSGKLDFRIDPERVELADGLEFLTNFLAACGKGDGLVIEPLMRGMIPVGVAATIDIQLPDITLGVFAISNLSLHIMFGVAAIPEFELVCELSVAAKISPFTLSVWILNGGGFLTQRLSFLPLAKPRPLLIYSLEVGIVAGVGLALNFGIVSGGVWIQVGCSIMFTWTTGPGGSTTMVTVFILVRGNVDIAGLITIAITLLLEISYDGARMIGAGTLRLSIKISVFYTLRVCQRVEYVFAGEKKSENYSESYN
jgi:hypothetical protein